MVVQPRSTPCDLTDLKCARVSKQEYWSGLPIQIGCDIPRASLAISVIVLGTKQNYLVSKGLISMS